MKIKLLALSIALAFFSCETAVPPAVADLAMCHPLGATDMADFTFDPKFGAAHPNPLPADFQLLGDTISFLDADGKRCFAYQSTPEGADKNRWLILFHEWWGLNDYIKNEADYWSKSLNINVLAVDLYDGQTTKDPEIAGKLMRSNDENRSNTIIEAAFKHLGPEANIRTMGWCFGGGWALKAALLGGARSRGCVMFYGLPIKDVERLAKLNCDVMFIHPTQDKWITQEVVEEFQANMEQAQKNLVVHQFEADHAFANPSNPRFNPEAADGAKKYAATFLSER